MDVLIALRGLSYQFGEAASKFNVKNLFDAASFNTFIIRQRIKLSFSKPHSLISDIASIRAASQSDLTFIGPRR